jgi:endonuclease YncB( thermonuclease family)
MGAKKKAKFPTWKKLLAVALATATIGVGSLAVKSLPYYIGEDVLEVVDGDTFFIKANHQPIRLYGVNAPELGFCLGDESRRALSNLILRKKVFLRNPFADGSGRVMALVYADGKLVNEIMVRAGLVDYRQGGPESTALKVANDYARENKIGIFSEKCYQTVPPNPKCSIKGNDDEYKKQKVYFTQSCGFYTLVDVQLYRGDAWFCTEAEAIKAGFTKAQSCKDSL